MLLNRVDATERTTYDACTFATNSEHRRCHTQEEDRQAQRTFQEGEARRNPAGHLWPGDPEPGHEREHCRCTGDGSL